MSWKTVNNRFWEKGEHQGCVFVCHQCVRRSLCVSVRPSLKKPLCLAEQKEVALTSPGNGGELRPPWLHPSHKTTQRREGEREKGGGRETGKGGGHTGRERHYLRLQSEPSRRERFETDWTRDIFGPYLDTFEWRWSFSSELWPLCSAARCPPHTHWTLQGRTSAPVSGTCQLYLHTHTQSTHLLSFQCLHQLVAERFQSHEKYYSGVNFQVFLIELQLHGLQDCAGPDPGLYFSLSPTCYCSILVPHHRGSYLSFFV